MLCCELGLRLRLNSAVLPACQHGSGVNSVWAFQHVPECAFDHAFVATIFPLHLATPKQNVLLVSFVVIVDSSQHGSSVMSDGCDFVLEILVVCYIETCCYCVEGQRHTNDDGLGGFYFLPCCYSRSFKFMSSLPNYLLCSCT